MTKKDSASVEDVLGHKETKKSLDEQKLEKETSLLKVKREKRLQKIKLTKIRHRIAPKDVQLIEKKLFSSCLFWKAYWKFGTNYVCLFEK